MKMKIKKQVIKAITLLSIICVGAFTPAVSVIVPGIQSVAHADQTYKFGDATWTIDGTEITLYNSGNGGIVGEGEFLDCIDKQLGTGTGATITKITIESGVSANDNSTQTFADFPNLTEIDGIGNLNVNSTTNMSKMFSGCTSLQELDLTGWNTSNVGTMKEMFYQCTNLESITFGPTFSTNKVTDMNCMFAECGKLESLDVSKFNTALVNDMYCMFYECSNLEVIDVSGFSTARVTDLGAMFEGCSKVKELDVSKFNTERSEYFDEIFSGCSSLEQLDLSLWNTASDKNGMENIFSGCTSLWKLTLGSSFHMDDDTNLPNPVEGTTFDHDYVTSSTDWQVVGNGTDHAPEGDVLKAEGTPGDHNTHNTVGGIGPQANFAPDTYVWQGVKDEPIIEPSYTVTIPAELPLNTTSKSGTAQVTVGARAILPANTVIRITPDTTEDAGGHKWTLTNRYDLTGVAYRLGTTSTGSDLSNNGHLTFNGNLGVAESQTIYAAITGSENGFKYAERYTSEITWTVDLFDTNTNSLKMAS